MGYRAYIYEKLFLVRNHDDSVLSVDPKNYGFWEVNSFPVSQERTYLNHELYLNYY